MIRIMIADDVDLVLKGIQSVLTGWPDGEIIGVYQSVTDLMDALTRKPTDVLILDDRIDPDCAPLSVIERAKQIVPKIKLIIL